jgi:hypothetical protein
LKLAEELRQRGRRQFGVWNDAAFDAYLAGPAQTLQAILQWEDKQDPDRASVANFLELVYEGVGAGWLGTIEDGLPPTTFLAHCLATVVPNRLRNVPRPRRSEVLRNVWNLGEGLAREPQWLNQYAITRTGWSADLCKLDQHLADILTPVVSPQPAATWQGRLQLQVLNLRELDDAFVPGRMYLASPAVLCVENRMPPKNTLAVLLQKGGTSTALGSVGPLPEYVETFAPPSIDATVDAITINGRSIEAPLIAAPRQTLCIAAGFLVVSADDSQRLWLVESA